MVDAEYLILYPDGAPFAGGGPSADGKGKITQLPVEPVIRGWCPETQVGHSGNAEDPLSGMLFEARVTGDYLAFGLSGQALEDYDFLSADLLLEGTHLAVFVLELEESETGRIFGYSFGLLNGCSARLRMPLEAVNQNRWMYPREGALLKPRCQGERVDLKKVDRIRLRLERKAVGSEDSSVRFHLTPLVATCQEPPLISEPFLPGGKLLDELGQSRLHTWTGKSNSVEEVSARLREQHKEAQSQILPQGLSRWGGWLGKRFEPSGFFRTHYDGTRWWLVDPDGYVFWSAGMDCVRVDADANITGLESALSWLPEEDGSFKAAYHKSQSASGTQTASAKQKAPATTMFNYLAANLIRAFGEHDWYRNWSEIVIAQLKRMRFNTVANWSDWKIASAAQFPYVKPLGGSSIDFPPVFRDFPDVFHPDFEDAAIRFAAPLKETATDPAFIGYFLMNEPTWGFAQESPAEGMLFNTLECHTRTELASFLQKRYQSEDELNANWGGGDQAERLTFAEISSGEWQRSLTDRAVADLEDFSEVMVERYIGTLSEACRKVDPNHLNLGIRYYTVPPKWALQGMRHFDVFSMNCYKPRLPADEMEQISKLMNQPIMIGEWHFGALDVGLPASGIGHVPDQESRGKAYRVYLEDAAAKPWCVGVHYFILYDQSALGRFDGENYNIGFIDVCHRPYQPLVDAAIASHERMYAVAAGEGVSFAVLEPFDDVPEYLPMLFL